MALLERKRFGSAVAAQDSSSRAVPDDAPQPTSSRGRARYHRSLGGVACSRPMPRRDIHSHIGLEVRHGVRLVSGHAAGKTSAPCPRVKCAEDQVLSRADSVTPEAVDQVVHFGLVGNQHLADDAEAAGLPEQHQSDGVDVDDERHLADARFRLAARAPSERLVPMRIEQKRISRREFAHPSLARSSYRHVHVPHGPRSVSTTDRDLSKIRWLGLDVHGGRIAARQQRTSACARKCHFKMSLRQIWPENRRIRSGKTSEKREWAENLSSLGNAGAAGWKWLKDQGSIGFCRVSANWLGGRDSNPDTMVQSHVSYRWTTSQYQRRALGCENSRL